MNRIRTKNFSMWLLGSDRDGWKLQLWDRRPPVNLGALPSIEISEDGGSILFGSAKEDFINDLDVRKAFFELAEAYFELRKSVEPPASSETKENVQFSQVPPNCSAFTIDMRNQPQVDILRLRFPALNSPLVDVLLPKTDDELENAYRSQLREARLRLRDITHEIEKTLVADKP